MKLTVLVDNLVLGDRLIYGEPGLSFYIEADGKNILFDTGFSDLHIKNAQHLGVSLAKLDAVALSHGHNDHTWGLPFLLEYFIDQNVRRKLPLYLHPEVLAHKRDSHHNAGLNVDEYQLNGSFRLMKSVQPVFITPRLLFLGEIPRLTSFENQEPVSVWTGGDGLEKRDFVMEDTALVYKAAGGLVIITGCSHSGIVNIVRHAVDVTGESRILDIIGGLHLLTGSALTAPTVTELKAFAPAALHPCHCTSLEAKMALNAQVGPVFETGVGSVVCYDEPA